MENNKDKNLDRNIATNKNNELVNIEDVYNDMNLEVDFHL